MLKDVKISQVHDTKNKEFDEAMKIYDYSFPLNESRSIQHTSIMLEKNDSYQMFVAKNDSDRVLGFVLVYVSEHFALLDYMAVDSNFRSMGVGNKLLQYTVQNILSKSRSTLLLEIQHVSEPELKQKANRMRFYKNFGAFVIDEQYLMLGYGDDGKEIMNLMGISHDRAESVTNDLDIQQAIQEIRDNVYTRFISTEA